MAPASRQPRGGKKYFEEKRGDRGTTETLWGFIFLRWRALMSAASKGSGTPCCAAKPGDLPFTKTKLKQGPSNVAGGNPDGCLFQEESGEPKRFY